MHAIIKNPQISIIVPIYKTARYLPDCLESILAQTFTNYELILINDGSPDESGAICDQYATRDNRIRVFHKTNGGASTARNKGLDVVRGKYIGWVDSDDRIDPEMYDKLYKLAEYYHADIADCQYLMVNGGQVIRSGRNEEVVFGNNDFILDQFFNAQMKPGLVTKIYKKEIWDSIRFPIGRIHQDCYVNMRFALRPLVYVRTSEPLYTYIIRNNSITTTYTSREIRQAIYLYNYTMNLAVNEAQSRKARKYLTKDAINRFMGRYFEVSINANLGNQSVYNHYIWKRMGFSIPKYLLLSDLPIKTKVSYFLLLVNLKNIQIFLHKYLGKG